MNSPPPTRLQQAEAALWEIAGLRSAGPEARRIAGRYLGLSSPGAINVRETPARYTAPECDCDNAPFHLPHCARLGRRRGGRPTGERVLALVLALLLAVAAGLVLGWLLSWALPALVPFWVGPLP